MGIYSSCLLLNLFDADSFSVILDLKYFFLLLKYWNTRRCQLYISSIYLIPENNEKNKDFEISNGFELTQPVKIFSGSSFSTMAQT